MSGGLSSVSDADLMRMLGAARGASKAAASTVTVPSPFAEEPTAPEGLPIRVQPNNSAAPAPTSPDSAPAAMDLSGLSNGDLMRQLMAARSAAAKAPAPEPSFGDRFNSGPMARQSAAPRATGDSYGGPSIGNDQAAADALYGGLQRQADERLVGPSSAGNAAAAGLREFANAALLNVPRNAAAGLATLMGNGASFDQNYQLARDQDEALARQNPKSAIAGTVGGIGAGAAILPAWGGASGLMGRAGQAAITGAGYGAAGEFLDSKDGGQAFRAGLAGGALGGIGSAALEKAAPVVLSLAQRGIQAFRPAAPGAPPSLTAEAAAALREVGVDPAALPSDLQAQLAQAFQAKGVSPAVAREAIAADQGITLSRGQATQDPRAAALEVGARAGDRGARAQGIAGEFEAQQAAQVAAARDRLQGIAARGVERIDSPQAAFEAVADRARLAGDETAQRIAAARQAEQEALGAVSGPAGTDALSGAQSAVAGVREAAEQARGRYREAYGDVAAIPGTFAPGALSDVGAAVRRSLGPEVPIDPVLTPAAARALSDLDSLPVVLGLGPDQGPDLRQVEQIRKRLVSYYGGTAQNPTDRRAMGAVMNAFDQRVEDLMAVGRFGERAGLAASDALPIGDTAPAEAMRKARGLFRDYKEAFAPRGHGDVAGQRLRQIVERDASPSDMVTALFGSTTGKVSAGQMQTLARVRGAVGADSETWRTVQQALIARYLGGESQGLAGRLDYLLRGEGRELASAFLTGEQRSALGKLRGAITMAERARADVPTWVSNLERSGFDPNAIAASLFGSGVPGARVGAVNEAKAAKGFLGENSPEWAMLRQAAVQRLIDPAAPAGKIVDRLRSFTEGPGSGVARELFSQDELGHFRRLAVALQSTIRPDGAMRSGSEKAAGAVAKAVDLIAGAVAFKVAGPGAGLATYGAKVGQRALVGGVGAAKARASFQGGAPRVPQPAPVLDLRQIGPGSGLAAEYGLVE